MSPLPPGATIGILGGGQLGRMLSVAAARLGFDVHIFAPEEDSPAGRVSARVTRAPFEDEAALRAFAADVDVVTFEFENVPAAALRAVEAAGRPARPGARALEVAQDRLAEKRFLNACGAPTTGYAPVDGPDDLPAALALTGTPALLKTRRLGYDGKGQAWIRDPAQAAAALAAIGGGAALLEAGADFACEVSIIAARGADGAIAAYDLAENRHADGVLAESRAPAAVAPEIAAAARATAEAVLVGLDYVGVLAIEFFVMPDGRLLANEIAPRVHNSGHWTADACAVGQFERHIRAIAGWPLGCGDLPPRRRARMRNLLGDEVFSWSTLAADPDAHVTLYGKREARLGRKMGHVTWLEE